MIASLLSLYCAATYWCGFVLQALIIGELLRKWARHRLRRRDRRTLERYDIETVNQPQPRIFGAN